MGYDDKPDTGREKYEKDTFCDKKDDKECPEEKKHWDKKDGKECFEEKKHSDKKDDKECPEEKKYSDKNHHGKERVHHKRSDLKKPLYCLCITILIAALIITSAFLLIMCKGIEVDCCHKVLCTAKSIAIEKNDVYKVYVDVPPDSCITKIYASISEKECTEIDSGLIQIESSKKPIFIHYFSKNSKSTVGEFETTLVQPLNVGSKGATISLTAYRNNDVKKAKALAITVVYCSDCKD